MNGVGGGVVVPSSRGGPARGRGGGGAVPSSGCKTYDELRSYVAV